MIGAPTPWEAAALTGMDTLPPSRPRGSAPAASRKSTCRLKPLTVHLLANTANVRIQADRLCDRFPGVRRKLASCFAEQRGALSLAGEVAPYPEDFSRRAEETYLDVAGRRTEPVEKVRGRGLQRLS